MCGALYIHVIYYLMFSMRVRAWYMEYDATAVVSNHTCMIVGTIMFGVRARMH